MTPNDSESHYYDEEGYPDPPDNHVFDPYPPELTQENLDGFIYMMANPGMTDRVKIGYSNNVYRRMQQLNTAHVDDFYVIKAWATTDMRAAEKVCHAALKNIRLRTRREFFALSSLPEEQSWFCDDTGTVYTQIEIPAVETADFLSQELFRAGITFEEVDGNSFGRVGRS